MTDFGEFDELDRRISEVLQARAATAAPPVDAWDRIVAELGDLDIDESGADLRSGWRRRWPVLVAAAAAVIVLIVVAQPGPDEGGQQITTTDDIEDGGADRGDEREPTSIRPVAATPLGAAVEDLPTNYQLSPDGEWLAYLDEGSVCFVRLAEPEPTCVGGDAVASADELRWSPDSSRVVLAPDLFRFLKIAPITVVGVDGTTSIIAEPPPGAAEERDSDGAPYGPTFVDDDTVAWGVVDAERRSVDIEWLDLESGDSGRHVLERPSGNDDAFWIPGGGVGHDGLVYLTVLEADDPADNGVFALDVRSGAVERIGSVADDRQLRDDLLVAVAASDTHLLLAGTRLVLVDLESQARVLVADPVDFTHVTGALSPDGRWIAGVARQPGDPEAMTDEGVPFVVAMAPIDDVLAGSAQWETVRIDPTPRMSLSDYGVRSPITWTDAGLFVSTVDGPVEIELAVS